MGYVHIGKHLQPMLQLEAIPGHAADFKTTTLAPLACYKRGNIVSLELQPCRMKVAGYLALPVFPFCLAAFHPIHNLVLQVLVAGDPRPLALAKHCNWVVARRPLEALKAQANADEVVLSNTSGALLEGLASNFFVVADMAQLTGIRTMDSNATANGATANRASSAERVNGTGSGTDDLVLLTTGAAHAALQGITQRRVLEAAASIGLQVVEQPAGPNQ
eukprot:GHRR01034800.1.p1 GENE.GHRR01034800.1~~GHRR01034800.1.p1  ORF type:complete len:219 (-),score=53.38 GHRR01034800.1:70-726(-)